MGWLRETQGEKYTSDEVYYYINAQAVGRKPEIKVIDGEETVTLTAKSFT
jgi:hypothetical protein